MPRSMNWNDLCIVHKLTRFYVLFHELAKFYVLFSELV